MKNGPYEMIVAPEEWPGKKYRKRYCYEHHYIYWKNSGILPSKTQCVHHINGSRRDNRIENLVLIKRGEHSSKHNADRGRQVVVLKCPECKEIFERDKSHTHLSNPKNKATFCSRKCAYKFAGLYKDPARKAFVNQRRRKNLVRVYTKLPSSSVGGSS